MEKMTKVTAREYFGAMREYFAGFDSDEVAGYPVADVVDFIDKKIEQLDAKAEAARKRADAKKAEGDELRGRVLALVTDELQTADAITEALGDEDVTKSKVIARLTQLEKMKEIRKEQIKVGDSKRMAYALRTEDGDAADED